MTDVDRLTEKVCEYARGLGFELVGVTTPEPVPHYHTYLDWIEKGHHGEMGYMAAERNIHRRRDVGEILPQCQSVLVLGVPYSKPEIRDIKSTQGQVAAYAWGDDYHDVLKPRLKAIVAFIEEQVGQSVPNRWYTDTGPILEREHMQRAGLGWIGKNTCLIHPQRGSYFLLAEILLGIELTPGEPLTTDHCGSCRKCIEACPTDCILEDRTIDARRCISYLTIELKGPIPPDLRSQIGNWIFGCDICQQVCPWNLRFAKVEGDSAFQPRDGLPNPYIKEEILLSREEFNAKFKGSPVKRAKRRGYLRNVAVAMGNSGDPGMVPQLIKALGDEESLVRGHAAWALGQIAEPQARSALAEARDRETDTYVVQEIHDALSR